MSAGDLVLSICSCCFDLAPELGRRLEAGSVKACGLTMHEADKWESPRFLSMFLTLSWSRFEGASTLRPLAAYARRWAFENYPNFMI